MKLFVGLGNPEIKYLKNRHNVGYMFVDVLSSNKLPKDFVIKKSGVFMNSSGKAVKKFVEAYKISGDDLYIVHDDLDIPFGEFKIQFARGPKVHNGITSVEKELITRDFWRIRIGVDNRDPENRTSGEEYVLENFSSEEQKTLDQVLEKIVLALKKNPQ